jgi:hypothetical protein
MADDFNPSRTDSGGGDGHGPESEPTADATAGIRAALGVIDTRVQFPGGIDGISDWIRSVSAIVDTIAGEDLERTRGEIRDAIDQLLELNAHIQNLVRLKQLLS